MTVKITIIGMGRIGTSAGLALARHSDKLHRTGHDRYPAVTRRAQSLGALDKTTMNLPASVVDADIVFLSLPVDQIRDTLKYIAPDLKEGAVVMDTSPAKKAVAAWAQESLLPGRYYVGLTPVINPLYMFSEETGTDAAREDLFENGLMGIAAPQGTVSAALKLATDLTMLLGASPLYMDMVEVDSLVAATHLVPQLLSAGLVGATSSQPGWEAGRKVAGSAYAQTSASLGTIDPPEALAQGAELNKEHVMRILDNVIRTLQMFRGLIEEGAAEVLQEELVRINEARQDWLSKRRSGDWGESPPPVDIPSSGDEMRRWIMGGRPNRDR